jgi:DNA repair protein RadC
MRRFNIGDKVILDDESGVIESVIVDRNGNKYDVRYTAMNIMIATDVPEEDIQPWQADEQ